MADQEKQPVSYRNTRVEFDDHGHRLLVYREGTYIGYDGLLYPYTSTQVEGPGIRDLYSYIQSLRDEVQHLRETVQFLRSGQ